MFMLWIIYLCTINDMDKITYVLHAFYKIEENPSFCCSALGCQMRICRQDDIFFGSCYWAS